jgi:hypothetical protein
MRQVKARHRTIVQDALERQTQMGIAKTVPPSVDRLFRRLMTHCGQFGISPYVWGSLYRAFGLLLSYWVWILSSIVGSAVILGYLGEWLATTVSLILGTFALSVRLPAGISDRTIVWWNCGMTAMPAALWARSRAGGSHIAESGMMPGWISVSPRCSAVSGWQRSLTDSVVCDDGEMTGPIPGLLEDTQDSLVVFLGISAGQAKEYDAGRDGQAPAKGQCPEILVMGDDQSVLFGCPQQNRLIWRRPHRFLDGDHIVTAIPQFANDRCADILVSDDTHWAGYADRG